LCPVTHQIRFDGVEAQISERFFEITPVAKIAVDVDPVICGKFG
jgi:hypothetical protein